MSITPNLKSYSKSLNKVRNLLLLVGGLALFDSKAQITFPQGNILNLNSENELMYLETRILFNTGKFKASDYRWSKIYDSLDSRWFVTSCFNGDCRNDLLQSGNFVTDFGIKDTLCFIAFHVETKGITGFSKIRYRVYNTKMPSDSADLIYNIAFNGPLKIDNIQQGGLSIVNPVIHKLHIQNLAEQPEAIVLSDLSGKILNQWNTFESGQNTLELPVDNCKSGYYLLSIHLKNSSIRKKIFIESF